MQSVKLVCAFGIVTLCDVMAELKKDRVSKYFLFFLMILHIYI